MAQPRLRPWQLALLAAALASLGMVCLPRAWTGRAQGAGGVGWTSFTEELPGGNVRSIVVEPDGSVWFGTRSGLSHFDGAWSSYTAQDGLPPGPVYALAQTADGALWVGTANGLARAASPAPGQRRQFERLPKPEAGPVWALHATGNVVWVGGDGVVGYWTADEWRPVAGDHAASLADTITAIAVDGRGAVWLGGNTLYRLDPFGGRPEPAPGYRGSGRVQALLVTPPTPQWPETLWVGTLGDGLWSFNGEDWAHFPRPITGNAAEGIASNDVLALGQDDEGNLWIGTDGAGVSVFNRNGLSPFWGEGYWRTLTTLDGLNANAVGAVAMDHNGLVWLGTVVGVSRFDARSWRTFASPDLPAGLEVVTLLVDSSGALWVGTEGAGLLWFDGQRLARFSQESHGLPEDYVRTLVEDRDGYLWLGTASQGLFRARLPLGAEVQPPTLRWEAVDTATPRAPVPRAALRSRDGSLWFGTFDQGVLRFTPQDNTWTSFTVADGLPSDEVNQGALLEDSLGRLWVGTRGGLARLDPGESRWRTFDRAAGLEDAQVLSLAEMPAGRPGAGVWAGTQRGLIYRFDPTTERWETATAAAAPINALLAAPGQGLWWGTTAGLTRLDPATGLRRAYTRSDGLLDNEVTALAAGNRGELWVGTRLGLNRHVPFAGSPRVEITAVNGQKPSAHQVEVLSGEPMVITYAGYDLLTPANDMLYRTRLNGAATGDGWRITADRQAIYPGLPPGEFTFEVEAWSTSLRGSAPARMAVQVRPSVVLPLFGRVAQGTAGALGVLLAATVAGGGAAVATAARSRRRRREAVRRRFNPYVSGDPIQTSDMFFGRQETLARIANILHENNVMIQGERRIGKTSLLYQLLRYLRETKDPEYWFIPVYVDLEGTPEQEFFHLLMEEILAALPPAAQGLELRFHGEAADTYSDRDFSHDISRIVEALQGASDRQVRIILLLDEVDVMNTYDQALHQQLRRVFMRTFARNLGMVVAGLNISKQWDRLESPWYNLFTEIRLGPLDEQAARQLILEPVRGVYTYEPAAVDLILRASEGRPYYIQQHCLEAVNQMLAAGRTRVTLRDAQKALEIVTNARTSQPDGSEPSAGQGS
ncbi:MAG: AAA family ATPase [Caldilineales bacterium]|nr:AAA family ATPase [Caldilineales bacterium]